MALHTMRKLPGLTPDNTAFWTGGARGELLISRCAACRYYMHPPSPICLRCRERNVVPEPVSGRGTVYSFTINHQRWLPDMEVPFVFAMIELEEQSGLLLMSNVVNCPVETVSIGMKVRVLFERHDDVWLPLFQPLTSGL